MVSYFHNHMKPACGKLIYFIIVWQKSTRFLLFYHTVIRYSYCLPSFPVRCQGGQLFLAGAEKPSGHNWQDATQLCTNYSGVLPLGKEWPQSSQVLSCYLDLFQELANVRAKNVSVWSGACNSNSRTCGSYVTVPKQPYLAAFQQDVDSGSKDIFTNVVCLQGED